MPGSFSSLIQRLLDHLKALQRQVDEIETHIKAWHSASEASQRLKKVPGIGPFSVAALVATVGDAKNFDKERQFAARLGVVPLRHLSERNADAAAHQQAWRRLLADHADTWCSIRHLPGDPEGRSRRLAGQTDGAPQQEHRGGRDGEQDSTNRLGAIGARPRVQVRPRRRSHAQHLYGTRKALPPIAQATIKLMVRQVRPWSPQPTPDALRMRVSDWALASRTHQGRRACSQRKSGCEGAISSSAR